MGETIVIELTGKKGKESLLLSLFFVLVRWGYFVLSLGFKPCMQTKLSEPLSDLMSEKPSFDAPVLSHALFLPT